MVGLFIAAIDLGCLFAIAGGLLEFCWPALLVPPGLLGALAVAFLVGKGDPGKDHAFLIERLALMTDATVS